MIDPRKGLKSVSMSYLGANGLQRWLDFTTMPNVPKDLELSMGWHEHRAWSIVFRRRDLERGGVEHTSFRTFVNGLRKRMEPIALKFPARICENLALEYSKLCMSRSIGSESPIMGIFRFRNKVALSSLIFPNLGR